MTADLKTRARQRADALWHDEGRPDDGPEGRDYERLRRAEQQIAAEAAEARASALAPRPPAGTPPLGPSGGVAGPRQPERSRGRGA